MSTPAGRHPDKLTPYDHRDTIMTMVAELAQSLVPEDQILPPDAIHRLDILLIEVSHALGISPDDEGPSFLTADRRS
jgi:hypothetical protein